MLMFERFKICYVFRGLFCKHGMFCIQVILVIVHKMTWLDFIFK